MEERQREKMRKRTSSRLSAVRTEPNARLKVTNYEVMT